MFGSFRHSFLPWVLWHILTLVIYLVIFIYNFFGCKGKMTLLCQVEWQTDSEGKTSHSHVRNAKKIMLQIQVIHHSWVKLVEKDCYVGTRGIWMAQILQETRCWSTYRVKNQSNKKSWDAGLVNENLTWVTNEVADVASLPVAEQRSELLRIASFVLCYTSIFTY